VRVCACAVTSPRGSISPRSITTWKTPQSISGDPLTASDSTSGSGHVITMVGLTDWLGADAPSCRAGILGRRRAGGRAGRSTVTFLSPVRDGRPSSEVTAALDDRPYAATLKADRGSAVPVTVTSSASLPRRRHEVWPVSARCPQCSPRSAGRSLLVSADSDCGRCRDRTPSCVTDGRLATSSELWPSGRATPSEWPLNDDSTNIEARLHLSEDTPV